MLNSIHRDLIRGHIDTIILKSLFEGDRYGYDIIKEVELKSSGQYKLKQPTLYSCLRRLEKQGLIQGYWGDKAKGGQRKYYSMTDMGRDLYTKSQAEWEYSRTVIDSLISDRDFDLSMMPPEFVQAPKRERKKKAPTPPPIEDGESNDINDAAKYKFRFEPDNSDTDEPPPSDANDTNEDTLNDNDTDDVSFRTFDLTFDEPQQDNANVSDSGDVNSHNNINYTNIINNYYGDAGADEQTNVAAETADIDVESAPATDEVSEQSRDELLTEIDSELNELYKDLGKEPEPNSSPVFIVINNPPPTPQANTVADKDPRDMLDELFRNNLEQGSFSDKLRDGVEPSNTDSNPNYFVDFSDEGESDSVLLDEPQAPPEPSFISGVVESAPEEPKQQDKPVINYSFASSYDDRPNYKQILNKLTKPAFESETDPDDVPDDSDSDNNDDRVDPSYTYNYPDRTPDLTEVSRSVTEMGDSLMIRSFDNSVPEGHGASYFYYSNKLLLVQNLILFAAMLLQIIAVFAIFSIAGITQEHQGWFYVGAVILAVLLPVFAFVLSARDYDRTKRYESSLKTGLIFKTLIMIQFILVIYAVNLLFRMPANIVGTGVGGVQRLVSFFLPAVLTINFPISAIVFDILYKSRKFAVDV